MSSELSRRRALAAVASLTTVSLAGCTGGGGGDDDTSEPGGTTTPSTAVGTETQQSDAGTDPTATTDDLDLREANVTAVAVEAEGSGYRFSVTLYHDDDGEDGYANWWQVERLDGTRLGRRELLHAHGTQEFTRSATIEVPDDVACVVVRGHDQTHGYGGQAMVISLPSGESRPVRQGPDREPVAGC